LLAFGLGAFAGAAALRQLVLAARAARRAGQPWWRGVVGRANGGMVVHLGVVIVAVGFAASMSFAQRDEFSLKPGQTARVDGHRITYLGVERVKYANRTSERARVRVDAGRVYRPALSKYPFATQAIGTPSVRVGVFEDVYLTLVTTPDDPQGRAVIGVIVTPLVNWLWAGGLIIGLGTALALVPGRRRVPTAPASQPLPEPEPEPVTV
jgi:cytochrome c-type biogenesis protein CcmF